MGFRVNEGGRVSKCPIPTEPTHPTKRGKSDVGDVVEGGQLKVGGEDPQVTPPFSSGGVPSQEERTLVSYKSAEGSTPSERSYPCAGGNGGS